MKVNVSELRQAANIIFDHLESLGHNEIDIDQDYYWNIPDGKLYTVYEEPSGFTMGQLSDDLNEMRKINSGQKAPIAFAFVWLSPLLRALGTKIVS
jgi:hypothetical protein